MSTETYDDLRPYYDSEIPAAMRRIATDPTFDDLAEYAFPDGDTEEFRKRILRVKTAEEFQMEFSKPLLDMIVKSTMTSFTVGGLEHIADDKGHLFISDHRDIVLDGALLQYLMLDYAHKPTTEITFGSNLISSQFVEDFGRSNKMFKILRGGSPKDLVQNSYVLSKHLHDVVADGRSIWISQRDGRTKDGNDKTDQGLVKMFTLDGRDDMAESLISLNITPVAISYEFESCDALKAQELYVSRRETYVKAPGEDMKSILTGIQQFKGRVHMEVCAPITPEEIRSIEGENVNEILRGMAALIDRRIIGDYKLFDTNYMAYDIMEGTNAFDEKYTPEAREKFEQYLRMQAERLTGDKDELYDIMLDIYANPVRNKLAIY